ncbi:MAG: VOC family protein [Candidatus Latescibacterota bacterium]|mgnify:FL=1|jgi:catechol 2,3-dioxygenase-like lactoylglutathione lyase family enzyme|nr:VOC family protein [Candidatus Latescibacterota bacterium]
MSTTLVHVGVRASDLEATIRFWRDGLGLPVFSQQENCYDLSDGFHNFRVFQHNGPARPAHVSGMLDYLHIGIRVPDLEVAAQRLLDMGYEIFSDGLSGKTPLSPDNLSEGAFKVEDPDGITIDVTSSDDQWPGAQLEID